MLRMIVRKNEKNVGTIGGEGSDAQKTGEKGQSEMHGRQWRRVRTTAHLYRVMKGLTRVSTFTNAAGAALRLASEIICRV